MITKKQIEEQFGIGNYNADAELKSDEEVLAHVKACHALCDLFEDEEIKDILYCVKVMLKERARVRKAPDTISVNARSMYLAWKEIERLERTTPDGEEDDI